MRTTKKLAKPVQQLEAIIRETNLFPDYVKDIYLSKIQSGEYSEHWVKRVEEVLSQLGSFVYRK
jgi:hypothetical protein